jgi:nitrous oxidase accessory protein NosD
MESGIRLFRSGNASEPSRGYAVLGNVFTGDKVAILVDRTEDVTIQDNEFIDDGDGVKVEGAGEGIRSTANRVARHQP